MKSEVLFDKLKAALAGNKYGDLEVAFVECRGVAVFSVLTPGFYYPMSVVAQFNYDEKTNMVYHLDFDCAIYLAREIMDAINECTKKDESYDIDN